MPIPNASGRLRIAAIVLLLVVGVNALAAGFSFITDPSGAGLGMSVSYLRYSPFQNFLIPGITLFVYNGILGLVAAVHGMMRSWQFPGMCLVQGYILLVWIVVQMIMVRDFNLLHLACLLTGVFLIILGRTLLGVYPWMNQHHS